MSVTFLYNVRVIVLLTITCATVRVYGQPVSIEWEYNYGGTAYDQVYDVVTTADPYYVAISYTESVDNDVTISNGIGDFWVTKFTKTGNLIWEKNYGGSSIDFPRSLASTFDGGFVLLGYTYSSDIDVTANHGGSDFWAVKIDSLGNLEWERSIGGSSAEWAFSIIQTKDSNFVFTGWSSSLDGDIPEHLGSTDYNDLIVGKLDTLGNLLWIKVYGWFDDDEGADIIETATGDLLVCGTTVVEGTDGKDYYLLKLDANGNLLWEKKYGGSGYDYAKALKYNFYDILRNYSYYLISYYSLNGDKKSLMEEEINYLKFLDLVFLHCYLLPQPQPWQKRHNH